MTTGQRTSTKQQLLEKYPGLRCESYGLGADRRLHLFKESADEVNHTDKMAASDTICNLVAPAVSMVKKVSIKNTFIDDWCSPIVEQRAVQSMPHGMFRQSIREEGNVECCESPTTAGNDTASEAEAEYIAGPATETQGLPIGSLVVVEGLAKMPAFNGCTAVVQSWDEETGRYSIMLAAPGGYQQAKIKMDNLRLVLACP